MNMANTNDEELDIEYRADFGRRPTKDKEKDSKARKLQYARAGRAPSSHNGIHRRRNKRFSW